MYEVLVVSLKPDVSIDVLNKDFLN